MASDPPLQRPQLGSPKFHGMSLVEPLNDSCHTQLTVREGNDLHCHFLADLLLMEANVADAC